MVGAVFGRCELCRHACARRRHPPSPSCFRFASSVIVTLHALMTRFAVALLISLSLT